jgi:hypothetical protein
VVDAPRTSIAAVSEKKAVKCTPVIGERTDDVAVIVDPKLSRQEGTWNGDAGEPSLRQKKRVVADSVAEVPDDLLLESTTRPSIGQERTWDVDVRKRAACQKETMFAGTIKELPNDVTPVVQPIRFSVRGSRDNIDVYRSRFPGHARGISR